jgi:hypothetical protein
VRASPRFAPGVEKASTADSADPSAQARAAASRRRAATWRSWRSFAGRLGRDLFGESNDRPSGMDRSSRPRRLGLAQPRQGFAQRRRWSRAWDQFRPAPSACARMGPHAVSYAGFGLVGSWPLAWGIRDSRVSPGFAEGASAARGARAEDAARARVRDSTRDQLASRCCPPMWSSARSMRASRQGGLRGLRRDRPVRRGACPVSPSPLAPRLVPVRTIQCGACRASKQWW